jgi:hypothetical protein
MQVRPQAGELPTLEQPNLILKAERKLMKQRLFFFIFSAAAILLATLTAEAADIKVIANSSVAVSEISSDELKRIFLATKTSFSDGSRAEPVMAKGGAVHETFVREYLGKTDSALQTYYRSLVFTGKGSMPKTFASDADIIVYVARTAGAIAYVSASAAAGGVKTIDVK